MVEGGRGSARAGNLGLNGKRAREVNDETAVREGARGGMGVDDVTMPNGSLQAPGRGATPAGSICHAQGLHTFPCVRTRTRTSHTRVRAPMHTGHDVLPQPGRDGAAGG